MDGFISVERFQSLMDPDKLLSLSFWRDEEAVAGWRACAGHRGAQSAGRRGIFRDYRLRVAAVSRLIATARTETARRMPTQARRSTRITARASSTSRRGRPSSSSRYQR